MIISTNVQSDKLLPCAGVWAPLQAVVLGPVSSAQNVIVQSVIVSDLR